MFLFRDCHGQDILAMFLRHCYSVTALLGKTAQALLEHNFKNSTKATFTEYLLKRQPVIQQKYIQNSTFVLCYHNN